LKVDIPGSRTIRAATFFVLIMITIPVLGGCPGQKNSVSTPQKPAEVVTVPQASAAGFNFTDVQEQAGVRFTHTDGSSGRHYFIEQVGAGCAFLDFDNDGLLDILAVTGAPLPGYKGAPDPHLMLWHNLGGGKFEDVTKRSGLGPVYYGLGVCAGDFDNDGFIDFYITCYGTNHLYRNMGNGTFKDVAVSAGVAGDNGIHTSACFVDYDNDGLLDLYVDGYVKWEVKDDRYCPSKTPHKSYCGPEVYPARHDTLYRNNGNGTFTDVSAEAHIVQPRSKSLGVVASDLNDDGWPDLYVTCDLEPNLLFLNNGKKGFVEQGVQAGVAYSGDGASEAGMGICASDYDNDGRMDLYVTNYSFEMDGLYKNQGSNFFSYESTRSGIGAPTLIPLGFGTRFADFDNDGWQDVVIAEGHVLDDAHEQNEALEYAQTMMLLRNREGKFSDVSKQAGSSFQSKYVGRGLAIGDFDNDGRIDILVNNMNGPLRLIRNQTESKNHWITLQLVGSRCNRSAIGARVIVKTKRGQQTQEVVSGSSYESQSDLRLHFGIGEGDIIEQIAVRWPGSGGKPGALEVLPSLAIDQIHRIKEGATRLGGDSTR
jgi:hypothetical protein